jgi:hypothetical protein
MYLVKAYYIADVTSMYRETCNVYTPTSYFMTDYYENVNIYSSAYAEFLDAQGQKIGNSNK